MPKAILQKKIGQTDVAALSFDGRPNMHVDLQALADNYRLVASRVMPAKMSAVIKANAYGLGAVPVMLRLAQEGCRDFWIADLSEVDGLRRAVREHLEYKPRDFRFYVLNGVVGHKPADFLARDAVPVLNTVEDIRIWNNAGPFILHVDTGMNRLGLNVEDICRLYEEKSEIFSTQNLVMVMSHMACADEPDHPMNATQLAQFTTTMKSFFPEKRATLANSSACFLGADFHFDMVRVGAALYGIRPSEISLAQIKPVVTVSAPVLQIRAAMAGETVGYGATRVLGHAARLATIGIGYAHGIFARPEGVPIVSVNGASVPVVGRVSMDSIVVDISVLPDGALTVGDRVEIIGKNADLHLLAKYSGTLPYEILTRFGGLAQKNYKE